MSSLSWTSSLSSRRNEIKPDCKRETSVGSFNYRGTCAQVEAPAPWTLHFPSFSLPPSPPFSLFVPNTALLSLLFPHPPIPSFLFYLDLARLHDFHRVRESRIHMATYPSFFLFSFSFLPIEGIVQLGKFFFYPISGNSSEIPYDTIRVNRFNLKFFYLSRLIIDTNRNTIFQLFVRIIE